MNTEYGEIIIYETRDGKTSLEVQLEQETVWLTQNQLAELFGSERSVITKHINNIFKSRELKKDSVSAKFAHTAPDGKTYQTNFYNLDVFIAVGYRVNAKRGTQFRIWATSVLRDHLIKGYTVNERRLAEKGLSEMELAVALLAKTLERHETLSNEGRGVLEVVSRYAKSWSLILKYDEDRLELPPDRHTTEKSLDYDKAKAAIKTLKSELAGHGEASNLFGQEQGRQLQGILGNIAQTFNGHELYPNTEEKAAHLL